SIPLAANVVESGSGVLVSLPSIIAVNESGVGVGVLTVYNSESVAQTLGTILADTQQGVTWTFTPNCDGAGGSTIAAQHACSVAYVYQTTATSTSSVPSPVSVSVPVTLNGVTTTIVSAPSQQAPVPSAASPAPLLVYPSGATVRVPAVDAANKYASIVLQNLGNGTLTSVTGSASNESISVNTSNCANVASMGICTVTVSESAPFVSGTVTLTPSTGSAITVSVVDQRLTISPTSVNFGSSNYGGTIYSKMLAVTNLGSESIAGLGIANSFDSGYSVTSNTCGSSLAKFSSCYVTVQYVAPNEVATESGIVTASATDNNDVTTTFTAGSLLSAWTNLLANAPESYSVYPVLAMDLVNESFINFGVSPQSGSGIEGYKNVWSINESGNGYANLTASLASYTQSAPTAIWHSSVESTILYVGHYNGSVQLCSTGSSDSCIVIVESSNTLGVTSFDHLSTVGFASFSDKNSGLTGKLMYAVESSESVAQVAGITAAVGRLGHGDHYIFAPLSNGKLATVDSAGNVVSSNIAPTSFATTGEYPTVAYVSESHTLYMGTNMGNVYKSTVDTPESATSATWSLLTTEALSSQSFVSAIVETADGTVYVGLVNLSNPTTGGALFSKNILASSFSAVAGYTDKYSISAIITNENHDKVYVSTYAGNIWQR
nr:hypothetical protein [Burkholderiales bacterium]